MYRIRAAIFILPIPLVKIAHNFWVLEEVESHQVIAELHGLATSRRTGKIVPIGYSKDHSLRVHHIVFNEEFARKYHFPLGRAVLPTHGKYTVYEGDDSLEKWLTAVHAIQSLNELDLTYPRCGIALPPKETINSNSIFHTLADIMAIELYLPPGYIHVGSKKTLAFK